MDFSLEFTPDLIAVFLTLFVLEIVLGVDNVIFISILAAKLPPEQQAKARNLGLTLAMVMRVLLVLVAGSIWIARTISENNLAAQELAAAVDELEAAEASATEPQSVLDAAIVEYEATVELARATADSAGPPLAAVAGMAPQPALDASNAALAALIAELDTSSLGETRDPYERGDVDMGDIASGWATEAAAQPETGTATVTRVVIPVHELSAMPKASQRLLDDAAFDVESWLAGRIADKFIRAEATAFISGDGTNKPKGFLTHARAANATATNVQIGTIASGATGDFAATNPANALIDLVYALGAQYRANATFVMNSKTAAAVRKMRDTDGRFLWADSLQAGEPARLMGYRVLICEDMPDIAASSHSVAFGDFGHGYTVAERPDLRVLRDPFSAKPHVLFYATKRVGGAVTDFAAIKTLRFAAT